MQLTQFTDLGLRVVMRLAVLDADASPSTRDVAEQLNVSYSHATKVVTRLGELGIVTTRRGRGGGLSITELGRTATIGWLALQTSEESFNVKVLFRQIARWLEFPLDVTEGLLISGYGPWHLPNMPWLFIFVLLGGGTGWLA